MTGWSLFFFVFLHYNIRREYSCREYFRREYSRREYYMILCYMC